MLSKNLIKANQFALKEKEPVVVDTNDLVAKRLSLIFPEFAEQKPQGFQSGLNAPEIDPYYEADPLAGTEFEALLEDIPTEPVYT